MSKAMRPFVQSQVKNNDASDAATDTTFTLKDDCIHDVVKTDGDFESDKSEYSTDHEWNIDSAKLNKGKESPYYDDTSYT